MKERLDCLGLESFVICQPLGKNLVEKRRADGEIILWIGNYTSNISKTYIFTQQ